MSDTDKIIGTGWAFPPRFDNNTNSAVTVTGKENIVQSLSILFGTQRGERLLEQQYGCDISSFLYRPITSPTASVIRNQIRRAILLFEPRIKIEEITLDTSESVDGKISIQLNWIEETTNTRSNMVFPFYAVEGSLILSKS
jgi:phage baseplate assembly protein W